MHLVVLDDDEFDRPVHGNHGQETGWTAQTVTDETHFQALISAAPPDAIMLDLQLGASDGVEQLRFLRSIGYCRRHSAHERVRCTRARIGAADWRIAGADHRRSAREAGPRGAGARSAGGDRSAAGPRKHHRPPTHNQSMQRFRPSDVAQAISAGRMELHLQPIVSAAGHVVTSAEALIRWRDPSLGLVLPDQFIPDCRSRTPT